MYYALRAVHQLLVHGVAVLAVMIGVMAFWRQIAKAVIVLLVAASIVGPTIQAAEDTSSARLLRGDIR
jgi:hypothetical protein